MASLSKLTGATGAINRDTLRLLLIGWTVLIALVCVWLGWPRLRFYLTPQPERVWVVSAALGDPMASAAPKEVLAGLPVTLFAIVETDAGDGERRYYGPVRRARLGGPDSEPVDVEPWSSWWYDLQVLWFKVEPLYSFDNEAFSPDFVPDDIQYSDAFMLAWGFEASHAADISPTGDAFPREDVGTMRFKAQAVIRDPRDRILGEAQSVGSEGVHAEALEDQPHRVTIRASAAPLGYVTGYAGLPYVPILRQVPAEQHPTTRYLGGTILDFWIGTQRSMGASDLPFISWEELPEHAAMVVEEMFLGTDDVYYFSDGPLRAVTFEDVHPGDLLVIEDHVGILYQDRSPGGGGDGILNRWDRILGGYFEPIRDMALGDAFVSGITVYRLPSLDGPEDAPVGAAGGAPADTPGRER